MAVKGRLERWRLEAGAAESSHPKHQVGRECTGNGSCLLKPQSPPPVALPPTKSHLILSKLLHQPRAKYLKYEPLGPFSSRARQLAKAACPSRSPWCRDAFALRSEGGCWPVSVGASCCSQDG